MYFCYSSGFQSRHFGPVHTNPDKFANGVFAPKTDKMFSVHTIDIVSFSIF